MDTLALSRLDLRHLVTFAHIARLGSFTQAAADLGYTQSAISQHIVRLEELVGERLVERGRGVRGVVLTPAGRVVLRHAQAIVAVMERASVDLGALARGAAGVLRVGCFESVGATLLGPCLAEMRRLMSHVQVVITEEADDGELLRLVETDQLDISFVVLPMPDGPFASRVVVSDPYVVAVAADSDWGNSLREDGVDGHGDDGPVDLESWSDVPLMSYAALRGPHSLERRSGHPEYGGRVVFRSNHNATLLHLAAHGYAAAVVSRMAVLAAPPQPPLWVRPLHGVAPREIALAWHGGRPPGPVVSTFIDVAVGCGDRWQSSSTI